MALNDGFTTDLLARTIIEIYTVGGTLLFQETLQMNTPFEQIVAEACIQIAKGLHVPQHCLRFVWQPPSRKDEIMWFVAQCCVQKLTEEDHERWEDTGNFSTCMVCLDPADDIDDDPWRDRASNCERCFPCSLCDECKVSVKKGMVCLQCLGPEDEEVLSVIQRRRRDLVCI